MKAITFEYSLPRFAYARILGALTPNAYLGPLSPTRLRDIPEPVLLGDQWTIVRTRVTGICGSDTKQIFMDADFDNPLTAIISFPDVPGHEVVGVIEQVGPGVKQRQAGERVLLNPWLSCTPRGIQPPCPACQQGLYFVCVHFTDGDLPPGMHHGNSRAATGGFAPFFPAHESQLFPIPDEVSDEQAVLADPFSVSLHAVLKAPPPEGGMALVYGCGTLGLLNIAVLNALYPSADIVAIARHPRQVDLARQMGAKHIIRVRHPSEIVAAVSELVGSPVRRPNYGLPWLMGGVDVIYDTVGSPETLEVGLRITRPRGRIVVTGVSRPKRFEWTPHYFKEIELVGSNAFGVEDFEGQRLHAMQIYLQLADQGRISLPSFITHRYRLEQYREALLVGHNKDKHQAIKVIFDFR